VASCSSDKTVRVWDLATGQEVSVMEGHTDKVFGVAMSGNGEAVVSCSWDTTVRVWDAKSGEAVGKPMQPPSAKAGESSVVTQQPGSTGSVSLASLQMKGHEKEVLDVAVTVDGSRAVSGSVDGTVRVWDVGSGAQLVKCEGHSDWVMGVSVTPNGSLAASCGRDATVRLWTLSGREVRKIQHTGEVTCVALCPDGGRVLSGQGKQVLVWDCNSGKSVKTLSKHTGAVRRVAVSPRGDKAVSGSQDMTVMIWDLGSLEHERTLQGHQGVVRGVTIGGSRVVSCGQDKEVRVWEIGSGRCEAVMSGQVGWAGLVLFTIIFLWTPPHFWALAMAKAKDYERAGVPMMPNVAGDASTRRQIMGYTIALVAFAFVPAGMGMGGVAYALVSALGGLGMLGIAWRILKAPDIEASHKAGMQMFGFSILYLFALFSVLLAEHSLGLMWSLPTLW
jgi:WD40 repeat protein